MSGSKQRVTISRDYKAVPDQCAQALTLLLRKSASKAAEPDPEPDGRDDVKESNGYVATEKYSG